MPNMDGFEATSRIRSPDSSVLNHDIPIIAMTARAMRCDREQCFEAGMNGYISKPFEPGDVQRVMDDFLPVFALGPRGMETGISRTKDCPIDREALIQRTGADEDFVKELVEEFVKMFPPSFDTLRAAVAHKDTSAVEREAHRIKGSAYTIEARRIGDTAKTIEEAGRHNRPDGLEPHLDSLQERFQELVEFARLLQ